MQVCTTLSFCNIWSYGVERCIDAVETTRHEQKRETSQLCIRATAMQVAGSHAKMPAQGRQATCSKIWSPDDNLST